MGPGESYQPYEVFHVDQSRREDLPDEHPCMFGASSRAPITGAGYLYHDRRSIDNPKFTTSAARQAPVRIICAQFRLGFFLDRGL